MAAAVLDRGEGVSFEDGRRHARLPVPGRGKESLDHCLLRV